MEKVANEIGKRIRMRRMELALSQADLAGRMGVDRSTIAKWESGDNNLKQSSVSKLSEVLRCSPVWLIGYENCDDDLLKQSDNGTELNDILGEFRIAEHTLQAFHSNFIRIYDMVDSLADNVPPEPIPASVKKVLKHEKYSSQLINYANSLSSLIDAENELESKINSEEE